MDDIRYSEFVFLQKLAASSPDFDLFYGHQGNQAKVVGLPSNVYVDMAVTLLEELFIRFDDQHLDMLVARLRGELPLDSPRPGQFQHYEWGYPRQAIYSYLTRQNLYRLRITYRGLRRIEELRQVLRRDRILERFGVLLDWRYVHNDLRDALHRPPDTPISVLYADLDKFKQVNDKHGHLAGDVVLKAYLEIVRDIIGSFGTAYRGTGDEVLAIVIGQTHERAVELAEKIRKRVEIMECEHEEIHLPRVTTSIGVATTPPDPRTLEIESVADSRNGKAKAEGRNCVIHSDQKNKKTRPHAKRRNS